MVDALGEAAGGLQVLGLRLGRGVGQLGRVQQRLGQQLQRADRGLQLVADVRHEVPPDPGQAVRLGHVGRLDGHVCRVQCDGPQVEPQRRLSATGTTPREIKFHFPPYAGSPHLAGQRAQDGVGRDGAGGTAGAQQAHRTGGGVDEHRIVVRVEHDDTDPQRVEALPAEPFESVLACRAIIVRFDGGSPLR